MLSASVSMDPHERGTNAFRGKKLTGNLVWGKCIRQSPGVTSHHIRKRRGAYLVMSVCKARKRQRMRSQEVAGDWPTCHTPPCCYQFHHSLAGWKGIAIFWGGGHLHMVVVAVWVLFLYF